MKEKLILVSLNGEQIKKAKEVNGARKQITHVLLCGSNGQIFGTEKHCNKYYSAWSKIFPNVFSEAFKTNKYEITDYSSTFDLVTILIQKNDKAERQVSSKPLAPQKNQPKSKSLLSKLFGR